MASITAEVEEEIKEDIKTEDDIHKSKLIAYESEISNLRADNALLQQDLSELTEAMDKLKSTVRNSDDTTSVLKTENQTLKLELQVEMKNKETIKQLQDEIQKLKLEIASSAEEVEDCRKVREEQLKERSMLIDGSKARVEEMTRTHAKEIGKIKVNHELELAGVRKELQEIIHNLESDIRNNKKNHSDIVNEYTQTVASQANRITHYEKRLVALENELNASQISQQLMRNNKRNQITKHSSYIKQLEHTTQQQQASINKLQEAMTLLSLNKHHDFRSGDLTGV